MADRARRFLRASTGKQDESKQLDDVDSYIRECGYLDDSHSYLAHGKSAYTGKHLAVLGQAFRDMADEQYDVLILSLGHLQRREYLKGHTIVASYDGERITAGEVISNDDDGSPSAVYLWTP
jgi:hypothetical protein